MAMTDALADTSFFCGKRGIAPLHLGSKGGAPQHAPPL